MYREILKQAHKEEATSTTGPDLHRLQVRFVALNFVFSVAPGYLDRCNNHQFSFAITSQVWWLFFRSDGYLKLNIEASYSTCHQQQA
uniref:Uncharacterized protein n=1 Tax=Triticum urartu TaxID=4572 RepID=A0A8R7UXG6_TRIUA